MHTREVVGSTMLLAFGSAGSVPMLVLFGLLSVAFTRMLLMIDAAGAPLYACHSLDLAISISDIFPVQHVI